MAARGQALVEFAITLTLMMIVLTVTIQCAIVGNAALAVSQLAYAGARYAAINSSYDQTAVSNYMISIASPTISESGGADLTITLSCSPSACPPSGTQRQFGSTVQVSVAYNLSGKLFLPNPFLGISFPTQLSGIQSAMLSQ